MEVNVDQSKPAKTVKRNLIFVVLNFLGNLPKMFEHLSKSCFKVSGKIKKFFHTVLLHKLDAFSNKIWY